MAFEFIWICKTDANLADAGKIGSLVPQSKITWYDPMDEREDEAISELLTLIEDHHGAYSSSEPWRELVIFGARDSQAAGRALQGDTEFDVDPLDHRIVRRIAGAEYIGG